MFENNTFGKRIWPASQIQMYNAAFSEQFWTGNDPTEIQLPVPRKYLFTKLHEVASFSRACPTIASQHTQSAHDAPEQQSSSQARGWEAYSAPTEISIWGLSC